MQLVLISTLLFGAALAQYDCRLNTKFPMQLPGKCGNYFVCYEGDRLEYFCRKNQLFNSYTKQCAPIADVSCLPTKQSVGQMCAPDAPTTFQADTESCSHYTSCIDGFKYQLKCAHGLFFNEASGACDLPENVKCAGKSTAFASTSPGVPNEDRCPIGANTNAFQPHPEDCTKFFNCIADLYYEYACPLDSHFNPDSKSCDTEANASCTIDTPDADCPGDAPSHPQAETDSCAGFFICYNGIKLNYTCHEDHIFNNETMLCDIYSAGGVCFVGDRCEGLEDYTRLPHDTDCDKYYKCLDGESHELTCPPSLHFNAVTTRCEKPADANCNLGDTTTTEAQLNTTPTEEVTTTTTEEITTTTTEEVTTTTEEPTICTGLANDERLPHEEDCSSYYICADGQPLLSQCPIPLLFHSVRRECVAQADGDCLSVLCEDFSKFPDSKTCNKYYQCMGKTLLEGNCPEPLHYNVRRGMCDYKHLSGCTKE